MSAAEPLAARHCGPCSGDATPFDVLRIEQLLPEVPGWGVVEVDGGKRLRRSFRFPDFAAALAFTDHVGASAEAEGHHPQVLLEWGRVRVDWWTTAINGLHDNDFIMAAKTSGLYEKG